MYIPAEQFIQVQAKCTAVLLTEMSKSVQQTYL